jgi:hypothetical protein
MREELRQELQRKIAEKFQSALGPKPPARSPQEREQIRERYLDALHLKSAG